MALSKYAFHKGSKSRVFLCREFWKRVLGDEIRAIVVSGEDIKELGPRLKQGLGKDDDQAQKYAIWVCDDQA